MKKITSSKCKKMGGAFDKKNHLEFNQKMGGGNFDTKSTWYYCKSLLALHTKIPEFMLNFTNSRCQKFGGEASKKRHQILMPNLTSSSI